jgi:LAO/AO transport system kinase
MNIVKYSGTACAKITSTHGQPAMALSLPARLAEGVIAGSRAALSRSITLVESTRSEHASQAAELLSRVAPVAAAKTTLRLGISGQPGSGKSTLIEALGKHVIAVLGRSVAVLAVDPSSTISHGSILGDKTRMTSLARESRAYVRPSPSSGALGGLSRRTDEAVILCEAAGYDVVFLETVGVGQSESRVADAADMVVLLVPPAAGDALQGSKKGLLELADLVIVTKSDGMLLQAARQTRSDYASALSLQGRSCRSFWSPQVILGSVETSGTEIAKHAPVPNGDYPVHDAAEIWSTIESFVESSQAQSGQSGFSERRSAQRESWMWQEAAVEISSRLRQSSKVKRRYEQLRDGVLSGSISSRRAAKELVDQFVSNQMDD